MFIVKIGGEGISIMRNYNRLYGSILQHCSQRDANNELIIRFKMLGLHLTDGIVPQVATRLMLILERVSTTERMLRVHGSLPGP